MYSDLQSATGKIRGFLAKKHNGGLDELAGVFLPHPRGAVDYEGFGDVIDDLVTAIAQRRVCHVTYKTGWRQRTQEMTVHPLQMLWHDGALYLFCRVAKQQDVITLAVHRINQLRQGRGTFKRHGNVAAIARRAFGIFEHQGQEQDVEIIFSKEFAWKIEERIYHPDEKKKRLPDGRLRYRVRSSAKWEIIPWVLRFGGEAELVRPKAWRIELAICAQSAAETHLAE